MSRATRWWRWWAVRSAHSIRRRLQTCPTTAWTMSHFPFARAPHRSLPWRSPNSPLRTSFPLSSRMLTSRGTVTPRTWEHSTLPCQGQPRSNDSVTRFYVTFCRLFQCSLLENDLDCVAGTGGRYCPGKAPMQCKLRDLLEKELPLYVPGRYNDQCVLSLVDEARSLEPRELDALHAPTTPLPSTTPRLSRMVRQLPRATCPETPFRGCLLMEEHCSVLTLAPPTLPTRLTLPVIKQLLRVPLSR